MVELNHCFEEIVCANAHVKIAADLITKYHKNVQHNLDATKGAAATGNEATGMRRAESFIRNFAGM